MEIRQGDILAADAEGIVNTVNCVGVMGRGIALQFKEQFPANNKAYVAACKLGVVIPGKMFVHEVGRLGNPRLIVNFPTKRHWRGVSRIDDIEAGLVDLVRVVREHKLRSIAIPPLGCGLGGLNWQDVKPLIEGACAPLEIEGVRVIVFEPVTFLANQFTALTNAGRNRTAPKMTPGRASLIRLMQNYLSGLLDPEITLLEVHKLMYFLQVTGEPLKLEFAKETYGPYAKNLRHVLKLIEGHFISGYGDGGDEPDKVLELVPGAVDEATRFLAGHPATRERFDRVVDVVAGFESSYGMELIATTHWIASKSPHASNSEIAQQVHAWGPQKQKFGPAKIDLAIDHLRKLGWLTAI
jgi:O-acetyl-ADP-ribose deacetylase (regulator of RNase III)